MRNLPAVLYYAGKIFSPKLLEVRDFLGCDFSVRAKDVPINHVVKYFGDLDCPLVDVLGAEGCMPAEPGVTPPRNSQQALALFECDRIGKEFHSFTVVQCENKLLLKRINFLERFISRCTVIKY